MPFGRHNPFIPPLAHFKALLAVSSRHVNPASYKLLLSLRIGFHTMTVLSYNLQPAPHYPSTDLSPYSIIPLHTSPHVEPASPLKNDHLHNAPPHLRHHQFPLHPSHRPENRLLQPSRFRQRPSRSRTSPQSVSRIPRQQSCC